MPLFTTISGRSAAPRAVSLGILGLGLALASAAVWGGTVMTGIPDVVSGGTAGISGAPGAAGGESRPYQVVDLPKSLHLSHSVIEIFDFGCPHCRAINGEMLRWGDSLPAAYHFTQMPSLLADRYFPMTLAMFSVYETDPAKLPEFEQKAFSLVQTYKKPLDQPYVYMIAAQEAGIDIREFLKNVNSKRVRELTAVDGEIMKITGIKYTPSLIICGKYVINPSNTRGNVSMFMQLANGLLSRCMMEEGKN